MQLLSQIVIIYQYIKGGLGLKGESIEVIMSVKPIR